jgi:hypothetical protein
LTGVWLSERLGSGSVLMCFTASLPGKACTGKRIKSRAAAKV